MLTFLEFIAEAAFTKDRFSLDKKGGVQKIDRRVGQSGKKNAHGYMTVLWYKHPRMGLRVIDHPGLGAPITHAEWMNQEGIGNHQFDKLPRGRFHIGPDHRGDLNVNELLHVGKSTPDDVYRHMEKNYKLKGKLFTPAHHITHEAKYVNEAANNQERTDISWYHHPHLGVISREGFHQHAALRQDHPDYKDAFYISNVGGPRLQNGFAVLHHGTKKIETSNYGDYRITPEIRDEVVDHLKKKYKLKGYGVMRSQPETRARRERGE